MAGGETTIAVRVVDNSADGGIHRSVRVRPSYRDVLARTSGGELVAFVDAAELRTTAGDSILYAVRERDGGVQLTVVGGTPPYDVRRGTFPRADSDTTLTGGPFTMRSVRDEPTGDIGYRVGP